MRPYGLEYDLIPGGGDVADIRALARKSSVGHFATKGGDFRSYTRSAASRAQTRRAFKRGARTAARKAIARELAGLAVRFDRVRL